MMLTCRYTADDTFSLSLDMELTWKWLCINTFFLLNNFFFAFEVLKQTKAEGETKTFVPQRKWSQLLPSRTGQ